MIHVPPFVWNSLPLLRQTNLKLLFIIWILVWYTSLSRQIMKI
jgi:hypothetical protein